MEDTYGKASLQTVRLSELERNDNFAREKLLNICMTDGFFWLDVGEDSQLARAVTDLLNFTERLFNIPEEEKRMFPFETTGRGGCSGFKAAKTEPGAFGTPDGFELCMLPYNELLIDNYPHKLVAPQLVKDVQHDISSHMATYHSVGLLILHQLSQSLHVPETQDLASAHDSQEPTTSSLTFLKYADHHGRAEGGHVPHTDVGTLTFLSTHGAGLQIFHTSEKAWLWVEPRQKSLLVNVGDSLSLMTDRKLRSCLHRVIPHSSTTGMTRYSFAYFMRPNEAVLLKMADGQVRKSADWHYQKIRLFGSPLAAQNETQHVMLGEV